MEYQLLTEDGEEVKATFRFPKMFVKRLKIYADLNDMSVTALLIKAGEEFMDRDKNFKERFKPHIA